MKNLLDSLISLLEPFFTGSKPVYPEMHTQVTPDPKPAENAPKTLEPEMDNTFHIISKKSSLKLSPNFNSDEFDCKCDGLCDKTYIAKHLVEVVQHIRELYGAPLTITSAYRCKQHNKNVGGVATSTHTLGTAVDLKCSDFDRLFDIINVNYPQYSIGRYNTFIHLDIRKDGRRWDYRK